MASTLRTCSTPIFQTLWSVMIPQKGYSEASNFILNGEEWKLKLISVGQTEFVRNSPCPYENWSMYIEKIRDYNFQKFYLAVYVRVGFAYILIAQKEISLKDTLIWSTRKHEFSASYPDIKVNEKILFIFEFVIPRSISQNFFCDNSAQTPSAVVPSYSDDRLCLNNLSLALRKLVDEGSDSDVQLKCGECNIAAHKLILGVRSEVFRTMLQSDMLEKRQGVIEIVDMEPKIFEIFIRYLYTGILPELTEDTATSLYETADKYHVEVLRERCSDFIVWNLTRENALRFLVMADAHSDKGLKDTAVTYVLNEKIPGNKAEWSKFCDDYPKLAVEVLNRAYK